MRAYGALLLGESASQWKRMRKRRDGWMTGGSRRCLLEPSEQGRMGIQVESSSRDERMSKNSQRDDMEATSREGGRAAWRSGRELKRRSTASPSAEWSTDTDTDQRDSDAGIKQRALRQAPDAAGGRGRLCGAAAAISSKREARRGEAWRVTGLSVLQSGQARPRLSFSAAYGPFRKQRTLARIGRQDRQQQQPTRPGQAQGAAEERPTDRHLACTKDI